ncbi:uncharacterized protein LOC142356978, partial [Convolutriloba macropyga]|uniref:uncharacterized protein LOC142356978 n=1 Tax=Convolutriloba macropyga TaxID=536237 RepID=UPI003F51D1EF
RQQSFCYYMQTCTLHITMVAPVQFHVISCRILANHVIPCRNNMDQQSDLFGDNNSERDIEPAETNDATSWQWTTTTFTITNSVVYRFVDPQEFIGYLRLKLSSEFPMVPIYLTVLAINLYVLLVVYSKKELQSLDYFLVTYQSGIDFIFTGFVGLGDYLISIWYSLFTFCLYGGFFEIVDDYIPDSLAEYPQWQQLCQSSIISKTASNNKFYLNKIFNKILFSC